MFQTFAHFSFQLTVPFVSNSMHISDLSKVVYKNSKCHFEISIWTVQQYRRKLKTKAKKWTSHGKNIFFGRFQKMIYAKYQTT